MATRPKHTEQDTIADSKHVAGAARTHFDEIVAADARRKTPLLPETRLVTFEEAIAQLQRMVGGQNVASGSRFGATLVESNERAQVYALVQEIRDEVNVANLADPSIGRVFGVGLNLTPQSTPKVLAAAHGILSAWEKQEYRQVAIDAGVTMERMEELRLHTQALGDANTHQGLMHNAAVGQTISKQQLMRRVRSEATYLRRVAKVVFRRKPEVLALFANVQPRRAVQPRTGRADEGDQGSKPEQANQAVKAEKVDQADQANKTDSK